MVDIDTKAHFVSLYRHAAECPGVLVFSLDSERNEGMVAEGWVHVRLYLSAMLTGIPTDTAIGRIGLRCLAALRAGQTECRGCENE